MRSVARMRTAPWFRRPTRRTELCLLLLFSILVPALTTTTPPKTGGMVLRVRLCDGSMERVQVPPGTEDNMTLNELLTPFSVEEDCMVRIGTSEEVALESTGQTLSSLGLQHGSLLTIVRKAAAATKQQSKESHFSTPTSTRFNPFPELAKDYASAVRKKQRRRGGMSYNDIAHVQNALHVVEPQQEGPVLRVYICGKSAERFQTSGTGKGKLPETQIQPQVGLLLGTIQRERVETTPIKTRTSLSSMPTDSDYCQVAKVHALWIPNQSPSGAYDSKGLIEALQGEKGSDPSVKRVLKVASWLGLRPVGWIFSYTDARLDQDDDSLPVYDTDVVNGARMQAMLMQSLGHTEGAQYVTLAMDAKTGATEAFQLSDVSVQMVAEGMLQVPGPEKPAKRTMNMKHEVLVDGQETKMLDSVLCLVNTALLSHKGSYASSHTLKKNGSLTKKSKKTLLKAIEQDQTDRCSLLHALSDFNVLFALDQLLPACQSEELCRLVRKWSRGQRKGTEVQSGLRETLQSLLST